MASIDRKLELYAQVRELYPHLPEKFGAHAVETMMFIILMEYARNAKRDN